MDSPAEVVRVTSKDGTPIAYWRSGQGPPLVLVHGTSADHTSFRFLQPRLEPHCTLCSLDRRGRGASGDTPPYHLAREFEDVATVVDALGGPVRKERVHAPVGRGWLPRLGRPNCPRRGLSVLGEANQ